jgi:hypothetical protein
MEQRTFKYPKSMKKQEQIDALYERMKTAGGFECALIDAYLKADGGNSKILEEAFKGTRFDLTRLQ